MIAVFIVIVIGLVAVGIAKSAAGRRVLCLMRIFAEVVMDKTTKNLFLLF